MSDDISPRPPARVRGRPFEKGKSGNPGGRRRGSRNMTTLAAAALLEGESEALTRKAVEMALAGDPTAMRLCMERVLPPCRERTVKFRLPPVEGTLTGDSCGPSFRDVSRAMNAVTSALAHGEITPGEAERIAGVVETFVRAIETTKKDGSRFNLLQILTAPGCDEDNSDDNSDREDYEENGDYEEADNCDS
ncbi:MAG TPA: DUF5681 domain-containing protein [Stellaceae bacterium]|nr:DUF5681 domain-containing protein [Stellaceae bacterium]